MPPIAVYNVTVGNMPAGVGQYISPDAWRTICSVMSSADSQGNCIAAAIEAGVCLVFCFPLFICHVCVAQAFTDSERRKHCYELNSTLFAGRGVLSVINGVLYVNVDLLAPQQNTMIIQQQPVMLQNGQMVMVQPNGQQVIMQPMIINQGGQIPPNAYVATNQSAPQPVTTYPAVAPQPAYSAATYPPQAEPAVAYAVAEGGNSQYIAKQDTFASEPAVTNAAPQPPQPRMMAIVVPHGVSPGQTISAQAPDGTVVQITVPPNTEPGQQLTVQY